MDSCAEAHLPTVVLRRLVLRVAHGVGGLCLVSEALRSWVFDLWLRDSKHSVRLSDTVSEKIVRVFVGETHTHSSPFRNASGLVIFFGSKLENNDPIMLGLIQLGADTCRVSDPDFRGAALGRGCG